MDVLYGSKDRNDESMYEKFIRVSGEYGLNEDEIREKMDYMFSMDFIFANQDRHLSNFGLLRDSDTMEMIGFAPIFDTWNSMYFDKSGLLSRYDLLSEEVTSIARTSADLLRNVRNRNAVDLSRMPDSDHVTAFYMDCGTPHLRAERVAKNYEKKLELYREFQRGKNFSLYEEKRKALASKQHTLDLEL